MEDFPQIPVAGDVITFTDYRNKKVTQGQVIALDPHTVLVSMWNEDGTGGYLWVPWLNIIVTRPLTFKVESEAAVAEAAKQAIAKILAAHL